jgi:hypothetical protein
MSKSTNASIKIFIRTLKSFYYFILFLPTQAFNMHDFEILHIEKTSLLDFVVLKDFIKVDNYVFKTALLPSTRKA